LGINDLADFGIDDDVILNEQADTERIVVGFVDKMLLDDADIVLVVINDPPTSLLHGESDENLWVLDTDDGHHNLPYGGFSRPEFPLRTGTHCEFVGFLVNAVHASF